MCLRFSLVSPVSCKSEKLIELGNATATAANIRASEWLLRAGIASDLIGRIIFVFTGRSPDAAESDLSLDYSERPFRGSDLSGDLFLTPN
jgi:hypothetical protein